MMGWIAFALTCALTLGMLIGVHIGAKVIATDCEVSGVAQANGKVFYCGLRTTP